MNILKVFPDTPMYYSYPGLLKILEKNKITKIKKGEFYIFINRARTAFKLVTGEGDNIIIVYYKSPSTNRPIDISALAYIPHFFGGKDAGYSKALEHNLRRKLPQLFN